MYKDELIYIHQALVCVMEHLIEKGVPKEYFKEYEKLNVKPHHHHKTKEEHKKAIFILSSNIINALRDDLDPEGRLLKRLRELAIKSK